MNSYCLHVLYYYAIIIKLLKSCDAIIKSLKYWTYDIKMLKIRIRIGVVILSRSFIPRACRTHFLHIDQITREVSIKRTNNDRMPGKSPTPSWTAKNWSINASLCKFRRRCIPTSKRIYFYEK
jgi:hypothetical protein